MAHAEAPTDGEAPAPEAPAAESAAGSATDTFDEVPTFEWEDDGFPRPVILIAGGRDKGGDYAALAQVLGGVGRAAILIGEAAEKMQAAFRGVLPGSPGTARNS